MSWLSYNWAWYHGAVWGNVEAMVPCGILAAAWAYTAERARKLRESKRHELLEELHYLAHTGEIHPRAQERLDAIANSTTE